MNFSSKFIDKFTSFSIHSFPVRSMRPHGIQIDQTQTSTVFYSYQLGTYITPKLELIGVLSCCTRAYSCEFEKRQGRVRYVNAGSYYNSVH